MSLKSFCVALVLLSPLAAFSPQALRGADDRCQLDVTPLAFGAHRSWGASSTARLRVRCSAATSEYTIAISAGRSGSFWPRKMAGPTGEEVAYNLFVSPSRQEVWGDGSAGTSTVRGRGDQTFTIFGSVEGEQKLPTGEYEEYLIITLDFGDESGGSAAPGTL